MKENRVFKIKSSIWESVLLSIGLLKNFIDKVLLEHGGGPQQKYFKFTCSQLTGNILAEVTTQILLEEA